MRASDKKLITLRVAPEMYMRWRIVLAHMGSTMQEVGVSVIDEYLTEVAEEIKAATTA
jgi:hypothetical protein